jgi:hypothetical protein
MESGFAVGCGIFAKQVNNWQNGAKIGGIAKVFCRINVTWGFI